MTAAKQLIATINLSSAADVQFTNIPQSFTDLFIIVSCKGRTTGPGFGALVIYTAESQSSSLSTWRNLEGNGSSATTYNSAYPIVGAIQHVSTATFGVTTINIPNYTSANKKLFSADSITETNATEVRLNMNALELNYTSPISFLGFGDGSYGGGLAAGSTISLYGITNGSGGATVS